MMRAIESVLTPDAAAAAPAPTSHAEARKDGWNTLYCTRAEQLADVSGEWERMERLFGTPVLTHNWFLSCAEAFASCGIASVVLVQSFRELRAIAPLSVRGVIRKRLEVLGSSITDEPGGFLFTDQRSLDELFKAVLDQKMTLFLKCLRFRSPETRSLEAAARSNGMRFLIQEERLPWVAVTGSWEEFERTISSSRRSSLRRLQRLAESKGTVEYEVVVPPPESVATYLEELYEVEASSWKSRTGTALKTYEELGRFFRNYSVAEAKRQALRLFFLRVNGKTIAAQLTVVHANRLWVFKIGHDESWSWCSPGILLMHRVVRYCFEQGLEACEFLGHDEPWLHIWANDFHPLVTYRVYPHLGDAILDLGYDFIRMCFYRFGKSSARRTRSTRL